MENNKSTKTKIILSSVFLFISVSALAASLIFSGKKSENEAEVQLQKQTSIETEVTVTTHAVTSESVVTTEKEPAETQSSAIHSVIYPYPETETDSYFDDSFTVFYAPVLSNTPDVLLYEEAYDTESCDYAFMGNIVRITGREGNRYRIELKPEGSTSLPVVRYIDCHNITVDRSASSWKDKYEEIIRSRENGRVDYSDSFYTLADMNSDGTPELIASSRSDSSDRKYNEIYSVYDGLLVSYDCSTNNGGVVFYQTTGCVGFTGLSTGENIKAVSYNNGIFTPEHEFMYYITSDENFEYFTDGETVSENEYFELRSGFIDEGLHEGTYVNMRAEDALKAISDF